MKYLGLSAASLFLCMVLSVPASASSAADLSGLTVTTIVLQDEQGEPLANPERLYPLLVIRPGAPFSRGAVRTGLEYLYLTGRYRDIQVEGFPDGDGVLLKYTFCPVTVVEQVKIEGNRSLRTERLRQVLRGVEGAEFREEALADLRQEILALYQEEGFFDADAVFRREETGDPTKVILHVRIAESAPFLIEEISIIGNTVIAERRILRVMKSERGGRLRREVLLDGDMEAIRRLYAEAGHPAARTGPVSMSFRGRKVFLSIVVNEGPKVSVRFTGNEEFNDRKLRSALLVWQERDVSDAVIESSAHRLETLYQEAGYADASVQAKKTASPGHLDLEFSIQEGAQVSLQEIRIEGNHALSSRQIRKGMELRESGWFRARPFREDQLSRDIEAIRDRYIDAGYPQAAVEKRVTRSDDGRNAVVVIAITEGVRLTVGSVIFEGNRTIPAEELRSLLALKEGDPFTDRLLEEDKYRILTAYSNRGHLYARVEEEQRRTNGTVAVRFRITEDRPVAIGKIIVRGNVKTEDSVITRELLVKEGETYDYGAILKSQQRIYRLGFFGLARFEPLRPGEREYTKDMLMTVEERPAGALEFGMGYGNLDRLRGFIELSYSNLRGKAQAANLRFEGSDVQTQAVLSFREPWLFGERLEARFRVAWSDAKRLSPDTREVYYETRKTEVSTGLEKTVDRLKLSLIYQFENIENYNVDEGAILSQEDRGRVLVSSLTPGLIWDLRDDVFDPRRGSIHGLAVKQAMSALGSEADFTKATLQTSWYLPLGRVAVAALSARAGRAWAHGDTAEVPIHERFYLGGGSTVRGYLQDSVGPQTTNADGTRTPIGGDRMGVLNGEVRFGRAEGFGIVLFADAGKNVLVNQPVSLRELRASYGIGLRYQTPVGPLRLDYGQKINRRSARLVYDDASKTYIPLSGESPGEIHFNIGHAF